MYNELLGSIKKVVKKGKFILTSGKKSDFYVDIKSLLLKPEFLKPLGMMIVNKIKELDKEIFAVGGMELGSVPISITTCIASEHFVYNNVYSLEYFIIRKEKRTHGTCSQVEGWENIKNKNVVLVDDVLTTGKSIRKMVDIVKEQANVVMVIVVIDREEQCKERLMLEKELDIPIVALFNKGDF